MIDEPSERFRPPSAQVAISAGTPARNPERTSLGTDTCGGTVRRTCVRDVNPDRADVSGTTVTMAVTSRTSAAAIITNTRRRGLGAYSTSRALTATPHARSTTGITLAT